VIEAVIFDLDGVLIDSESAWDSARRELVADRGGTWTDSATRDMLGMSAPEWSRYVRDELGVDLPPEEIDKEVVERLLTVYAERLPLIPGAVEAVERMAARWPLGLASSSNRPVIDTVLDAAGIADHFRAWTSSEEVGPGKPAPDVFVETARRIGVDPRACAAIEDSHNGILSAHAAEMRVLAIPNHEFPPGEDALAHADRVLPGLDALTVDAVEALG
jgi:HAD superfamily hydrolase (TIGR01509 family)